MQFYVRVKLLKKRIIVIWNASGWILTFWLLGLLLDEEFKKRLIVLLINSNFSNLKIKIIEEMFLFCKQKQVSMKKIYLYYS